MKPVCNDEEKLPILIKRIMYFFPFKKQFANSELVGGLMTKVPAWQSLLQGTFL